MSGKKSFVWNYFEQSETDVSIAKCNICNVMISRGKQSTNFTTSSMIRHLVKHNINIQSESTSVESIQPSSSQKQTAVKRSFQPTLEQVLVKKQCFVSTHPVAMTITKRICEMIAVDFLPLSVVENVGFRRLMAEIQPRFQMPSRKFITNKGIPEIYHKVKEKISSNMRNKVGSVSATTDIWSSSQNVAYMSMTVNFISWVNDDLCRFSYVLSCNAIEGAHTSDNILEEIRKQENSWGTKFNHIVSDNAANVVKALRDGNITGIRCMAHTLNLVIRSALESQRTVVDTLAVARKIVAHFHHSPRACGLIKQYQKEQNVPEHKFIQEVPTRWNSTYHMLERVCEQKDAIQYMNRMYGQCEELTFNQWKLASALVVVLKDFDMATKELSNEDATIAIILPMANTLKENINEFIEKNNSGELYGIGSFLENLKENMKRRFSKPVENSKENRVKFFYNEEVYRYCAIASALDPRFKTSWVENNDELILLKNIIESAALENESAATQPMNQSSSSCSSSEEEPSVRRILFRAKHDKQKVVETERPTTIPETSQDQQLKMKDRVSRYLSKPKIKYNRCPFEFWRKNNEEFPELFVLAMSLLSCPPTSVSSERLFSSSGIVVSPLRSRLKPEHVEMLTFLNVNLKHLNFMYE